MEWGNLRNWMAGDARGREFAETRAKWDEAQTLWRASPLAERHPSTFAVEIVQAAIDAHSRAPALPILVALCEATEAILRLEDTMPIEANWPLIESDASVAVYFRRMLARRRRWAADFSYQFAIVKRQLVALYRDLFDSLPEPCFGEWEDGTSAFGVPLIELLEDPAETLQRIYLAPYDDETLRLELFMSLRERLVSNTMVASGFSPNADLNQVGDRLKLPTLLRGKSATELADLYLAGTPFAAMLDLPIPFQIPTGARFEHAHIIGGTGHGKTQLMQRMIHTDLVEATKRRQSVVVIDSQGDLISKLVRLELFDPDHPDSLADRLVLIDPSDIEFPAALNLFDAHLSRLADYRPIDRERVLNGVVELYETFFGAMLGAELTQKQGVIFRYLARLMVSIPGATIHTLMQLMEDGRPFKPQMEALEGSARYFFQTEFFHPSFVATKKQILKRLWGVLSTPAFERMFAQKTNKLDLFEALQEGKIVLVSTAKDLLKSDGSALFGRFIIALLAQAALERSTVDETDRTPTYVYIDEAQEYFDDSIETILNQARKYKVGLTLAHQTLDQLSPRLRSVILANTSLKCVGGVSAKDARALADELHTPSDFIESMRRRGERTQFAVWLKNQTPSAVRMSVPLGHLERQPTLTEDAYDALIDANRARYCGRLADIASFAPLIPQPEERVVEEPRHAAPSPIAPSPVANLPEPPEPSPRHRMEDEAAEAIAPLQPRRQPHDLDAGPSQQGKGGPKHRYLQSLVKELAEQQGFRAVIEAPVAGGAGQVDVLLTRADLTVAVEVSVSTPVEWERENIRKCLEAGYSGVALVLAKTKANQTRYQAALMEGLGPDDQARLTFLSPEDLPDFIAALAPTPEPTENIVRGYRVKVSQAAVSPADAKARRETLARVISRSLAQQKT